MIVPPLPTLRVEDFPSEERAWLPRLLTPLNSFLTNASNAFQRRIEFGSNIPSQDNDLVFSYDGSPQSFRWFGTVAPKILWVGQALEDGLPIVLQSGWSYDSSTANISVSFYRLTGSGLSIGSRYNIFVRAVP